MCVCMQCASQFVVLLREREREWNRYLICVAHLFPCLPVLISYVNSFITFSTQLYLSSNQICCRIHKPHTKIIFFSRFCHGTNAQNNTYIVDDTHCTHTLAMLAAPQFHFYCEWFSSAASKSPGCDCHQQTVHLNVTSFGRRCAASVLCPRYFSHLENEFMRSGSKRELCSRPIYT